MKKIKIKPTRIKNKKDPYSDPKKWWGVMLPYLQALDRIK